MEQMAAWLQAETDGMSHAEVERGLRARGFDLMLMMYQAWLDVLSERERNEAERMAKQPGEQVRSWRRQVETDFGRAHLDRLGHKYPGQDATFPLDRRLNLPDELYSLEVRQHVALEAQRSSWQEVVETVGRCSGAHVPKRQAQELAQRAAQDFDAFYEQRMAPANDVLSSRAAEVASCDSKGVTMLESGLREETRKEAQEAKTEAVRGDPMAPKKLRKHDKRMAIVTANWEQERHPRTAADVLANLDRKPGEKKPKGPRPQNKRVSASVEKSQAQGISEMFDEMQRRNPMGERPNVVLVDGEEHQIEQVKQQAESRGMSIWIILDLIHVIHYLWMAANALCGKDATRTETWVRIFLERLLTTRACYVAAAIRCQATRMKLSEEDRKPVDKCCDYLLKYQDHLHYAQYLAEGFPIATGVIEGACRHLVQDRMGITGARWDVVGAEAVLRLRAIRCSGDWDEYWALHERLEFSRNHGSAAA